MDKLGGGAVARHRHEHCYAALVISGNYTEAGDAGRFKVSEGDILVHRAFEAHRNVIAAGGATVLNLPLPCGFALPSAFRIADPDALIRMGVDDVDALLATLKPTETIVAHGSDWPDRLAAAIMLDPSLRLSQWAGDNRLAAATVSRGFCQVFGVSPSRFRAEARTRKALTAMKETSTRLACIAHELGFADQAHMTRAVRVMTGSSPARWRKVK